MYVWVCVHVCMQYSRLGGFKYMCTMYLSRKQQETMNLNLRCQYIINHTHMPYLLAGTHGIIELTELVDLEGTLVVRHLI